MIIHIDHPVDISLYHKCRIESSYRYTCHKIPVISAHFHAGPDRPGLVSPTGTSARQYECFLHIRTLLSSAMPLYTVLQPTGRALGCDSFITASKDISVLYIVILHVFPVKLYRQIGYNEARRHFLHETQRSSIFRR